MMTKQQQQLQTPPPLSEKKVTISSMTSSTTSPSRLASTPIMTSSEALQKKSLVLTFDLSKNESFDSLWGALTAEERASVWYTRQDFDNIDEYNSTTIDLMLSQCPEDLNVGLCFRGLEKKDEENEKTFKLQECQNSAALAVFLEQERQIRQSGSVTDASLIAKAYMDRTLYCTQQASLAGLKDAYDAYDWIVKEMKEQGSRQQEEEQQQVDGEGRRLRRSSSSLINFLIKRVSPQNRILKKNIAYFAKGA